MSVETYMVPIETYLQIISMLIGVVAVALPLFIVTLGFVYIKRTERKIDNVSGDVSELWDKIGELSNDPPRNNK